MLQLDGNVDVYKMECNRVFNILLCCYIAFGTLRPANSCLNLFSRR
jgi:hypothetical protein